MSSSFLYSCDDAAMVSELQHCCVAVRKHSDMSSENEAELSVGILILIVLANYFQASVKCRKAQKCLYLTLSIQCHMQLKLLMSLTAL